MDVGRSRQDDASLVAVTTSVAFAVGAFGLVYGAVASSVLGSGWAVASSVLVFSGSAQFAMVGLLGAGASAAAVVGTVGILGLRHLPLGALMRGRMEHSAPVRAGLAWFLVDETVGLALTSQRPVSKVLAGAGPALYLAWIVGTVLGVVGAGLGAVEAVAEAVFPILFIGLASLASTGRSPAVRAILAGVGTLAVLVIWPEAGVFAALAVAIGVAAIREPRI